MEDKNQHDLQKLSKTLIDSDLQQVTNIINSIKGDLIENPINYSENEKYDDNNNLRVNTDASSPPMLGAIPEEEFVKYFLPFFKNHSAKEYKESTLLAKWVQLAGGVFNSVDIIDKEGNVVIKTPPVFNRNVIEDTALKNNDVNFSKIGKEYSEINKVLPSRANAELNRRFKTLPKFIKPTAKNTEIVKDWVNVIKYFDNKQKQAEEEKNAQKIKNATVAPKKEKEDLGLKYDD